MKQGTEYEPMNMTQNHHLGKFGYPQKNPCVLSQLVVFYFYTVYLFVHFLSVGSVHFCSLRRTVTEVHFEKCTGLNCKVRSFGSSDPLERKHIVKTLQVALRESAIVRSLS